MSSSPSTRRKLLLDSEDAPEDDQPCAWTCSYVMSSGDGVNLLGVLDVDKNRARFVANSGLFGTAYQFVMPRDQIQIVRVPAERGRLQRAGAAHQVPPEHPVRLRRQRRHVQALLRGDEAGRAPAGRAAHRRAPHRRQRPRQQVARARRPKRREREAAEALAARAAASRTTATSSPQVMHLHSEKVALQRRMTELERENEHLHGEVDVLYARGRAERALAQRQREALEAAAREAVDDALKKSADDTEEVLSVKREPPKPLRASRTEKGRRRTASEAKVPAGDGDAALAKTAPPRGLSGGETETRQNEARRARALRGIPAFRARAAFEGEVARLRAELERAREAGARDERLADAGGGGGGETKPGGRSRPRPRARSSACSRSRLQLSSHLESARRRSRCWKKKTSCCTTRAKPSRTAAETARAEKALAVERLSLVSAEERDARSARAEQGSVAPSSPPREEELTLQSPAGTLGTKPFPMASENAVAL